MAAPSIALAFCLVFAVPLATAYRFGAYQEIYPPLDQNDSLVSSDYYNRSCTPEDPCPLFFTFLISFGGQYTSNGGLPGVQVAVDDINRNPAILPGYRLHYALHDSNCSREVALSSYFTQMFQHPTKISVIGSGCSVSTEATAEVAYYFNLTQLSCISASPLLSNRASFKTHFQLLASDAFLAYGYFSIVKQFGWRQVAIVTQTEALFTYVMDLTTEQLRAENITYSEIRFLSQGGVRSLRGRLFETDARIYLVSMYTAQAAEFMCLAYEAGIFFPEYQFIIPGWYGARWWEGGDGLQDYLLSEYGCGVAQREKALAYTFSILQDEFASNLTKVVDSGINAAGFFEAYDQAYNNSIHDNIVINAYGQQCYDATWTLARALNRTMTALEEDDKFNREARLHNADLEAEEKFRLHHFTYNNSALVGDIFRNMENTDFVGITGRIRFNEHGVKKIQFIIVEQYSYTEEEGIEVVPVARIDFSNTSNLIFTFDDGVTAANLWPHGEIPYDGTPNMVRATVKTWITAVFALLATGGLIFAVICLIFNFVFRNTKLMRLSSPNLNYLILIGAIILYINMYLYTIPTTDPEVVTILCNIYTWMSALGYSLCFGTIVMKMGRIFYIFKNAMSPAVKRTIHDWMLAVGVLCLVIIDIFIFSVYTIISRDILTAVSVPSGEKAREEAGVLGIVTTYSIYICDSYNRTITNSVVYGCKAVLQVMALIFAFSIRKVNIKGLDDSPFIIAAIYVSSIVLAVILVSFITLKDFENVFAVVYCTGFFIGATAMLLLIFVPKMINLYRDPKGENIFKSIAPPTEMSSNKPQPGDRKLSRTKPSTMSLNLEGIGEMWEEEQEATKQNGIAST